MSLVKLDEDDRYRTSSQYRLWSFTPESLAAARQQANETAAQRVETALGKPVDPLTVDEELILIRQNCRKALNLIEFIKQSTAVKVSTVQFLKRFYVNASCMEYPPANMVASAVFLGAKANGVSLDLADFSARSGKKEQEIIAPEFKLSQGIRFAFEVRSPLRGLEGGYMMLLEIGLGRAPGPDADDLKAEMLKMYGQDWEESVGHAVQKTRDILKRDALLSDVYFLYTPPQIWLGALMTVDKDLVALYLRCTLAPLPEDQRRDINDALESCARILSEDEELTKVAESEAKAINQKLKNCTNPETSDLVQLSAAAKRDPDPKGAKGHVAKKLKTEKGKIEDPFGGPIVKAEPE